MYHKIADMEFKKVKNMIISGNRECPSCKCHWSAYCFICAKSLNWAGIRVHLKNGSCLLDSDASCAILSEITKEKNGTGVRRRILKVGKCHISYGYLESIGYKMLFCEGKCLICGRIPTGGPGQTILNHAEKCIAKIHCENGIGEILAEKPDCELPTLKCRLCGRVCYYCKECDKHHKLANKRFMRHGNGYMCINCGFSSQQGCVESNAHRCAHNY